MTNSLRLPQIVEKLRKNRLRWCRYFRKLDKTRVVKRFMKMNDKRKSEKERRNEKEMVYRIRVAQVKHGWEIGPCFEERRGWVLMEFVENAMVKKMVKLNSKCNDF